MGFNLNLASGPYSAGQHPANPNPQSPFMGGLFLSDEELMEVYEAFLVEDPKVSQEAYRAANEMAQTPWDILDRAGEDNAAVMGDSGKVQRRAPLNPFASPKLGKYRFGKGKAKISDPALRNNPLRGRLIVTIFTSTCLLFVFLQSLIVNYTRTGSFHVSTSINGMVGPSPEVLNALGGLNTNLIRRGETVRVFWSMWMHSGWIHILLNLTSQLQFLYMLEPDWGFWRTLLLFWTSGVTGNLMSAVIDPCSVTVGSSGALYGLMGGTCIYCIEYWKSIPRPGCILVFTAIVVLISFLIGFTGSTDNWAHLGGLIGGLLFASLTITSLTACEDCLFSFSLPWKSDDKGTGTSLVRGGRGGAGKLVGPDGRVKKKVVKRNKMSHLGKELKPSFKCGVREWTLRGISFCLLFVMCFLCSWYLWQDYEFQPAGHVTFSGQSECCCCYDQDLGVRSDWVCQMCQFSHLGSTWGEHCEDQRNPEDSDNDKISKDDIWAAFARPHVRPNARARRLLAANDTNS